jgi:transcriptional/translational regulatory protein YebC/TACO1
MEAALDAGAEDIQTDEEGMIEVVCPPAQYAAVKAAFEQASLTPEVQDIVMKPLNETELEGDDAQKMQKMLDALEGLDDVQEVYTTAVLDESEDAA